MHEPALNSFNVVTVLVNWLNIDTEIKGQIPVPLFINVWSISCIPKVYVEPFSKTYLEGWLFPSWGPPEDRCLYNFWNLVKLTAIKNLTELVVQEAIWSA